MSNNKLNNKLAVLGNIERRIATIASVAEARDEDGKLAALERFARSRQLPIGDQNHIVLIRALVQRRGGELVDALPRSKGGRGKKGGKLRQAGVALGGKRPSGALFRWVSLTSVLESRLREVIARRTDAGQSVTLGYLYGRIDALVRLPSDDLPMTETSPNVLQPFPKDWFTGWESPRQKARRLNRPQPKRLPKGRRALPRGA